MMDKEITNEEAAGIADMVFAHAREEERLKSLTDEQIVGEAWSLTSVDGDHPVICELMRRVYPQYLETSLEYEPEDVAFKQPASNPDELPSDTPTLDYVWNRIRKGLPVADSEKNAAIKEAVEVQR